MPHFLSATLLFSASLLVSQARGSSDQTDSLIAAVHANRLDETTALIKSGADVTAKNAFGIAAISLACQNGDAQMVKLLLEAGTDPNMRLIGNETPLIVAAETGKPEPVKLLLAAGSEVDAVDRSQQNALIRAAADGHGEVAELLIEAGADPSQSLQSGFTPILFAARNGHDDLVQRLISHGVDPNAVSTNKKRTKRGLLKATSPLRLAIENGHFDVAITLLKAGADPNDQQSGYAPLHILTWVRKPNRGDGQDGLPPPVIKGLLSSLDFAKILIEDYGAKVDLKLKRGRTGGPAFGVRGATPFLLASRTADLPFLKLLHENGADITATNADGTTPLLAACGVGSFAPEEEAGLESEALDVVNWLLDLEATLDHVSKNGETAMHGAAYRNRPELIALLDQRGATPSVWNQKNKHQWTPLLIAQGFRSGNFKPSAATITAIETVMRSNGLEPPPAPERPLIGRSKNYTP